MNPSHRLAISCRLEELTRVNDFLAALGSRGEISETEVMTLQLLLEEILVNVISHGRPADPDSPIEVMLRAGAEELRLEVVDSGSPFDPLSAGAPDVAAALEDRPIGGLGIHLVKKLSTAVGYRRLDERNHLWLTRQREI